MAELKRVFGELMFYEECPAMPVKKQVYNMSIVFITADFLKSFFVS